MRFDIITIFPNIFNGFTNETLIARAQKKKIVKINVQSRKKFEKKKKG